jgi:hypothetical protein
LKANPAAALLLKWVIHLVLKPGGGIVFMSCGHPTELPGKLQQWKDELAAIAAFFGRWIGANTDSVSIDPDPVSGAIKSTGDWYKAPPPTSGSPPPAPIKILGPRP